MINNVGYETYLARQYYMARWSSLMGTEQAHKSLVLKKPVLVEPKRLVELSSWGEQQMSLHRSFEHM